MLLNMTIANFKSVKSPQKISFEALKDNRLSVSKVVTINDKLKAIKTSAIIGPNGAGKSSFVRALEVLNRVVTSPDENENPLSGALAGTVFAYGVDKATPAQIEIEVLLDRGEGTEEDPVTVARYRFVAKKDRIWEETLYYIVNGSKKLLFERKYIESENAYSYRYGKFYRGEKKRLANRIPDTASFLGMSARAGSESSMKLYSWFTDQLHIMPMGVSSATEAYIAKMLTEHPSWREQLSNFFWAVDITDIRRVGVRDDGKVVFTHVYINDKKADGYSNLFSLESLSLRRLTSLAVAFFECFTSHKTLVIDDFGMLLHPDVLCHIVEIFEACNKESQMLVVDCNPSLLKEGLLRRDGVWFAQKDHESSTEYFSLADFKASRGKASTREKYLQGAFGALPITSEFYFVNDEKEAD